MLYDILRVLLILLILFFFNIPGFPLSSFLISLFNTEIPTGINTRPSILWFISISRFYIIHLFVSWFNSLSCHITPVTIHHICIAARNARCGTKLHTAAQYERYNMQVCLTHIGGHVLCIVLELV